MEKKKFDGKKIATGAAITLAVASVGLGSAGFLQYAGTDFTGKVVNAEEALQVQVTELTEANAALTRDNETLKANNSALQESNASLELENDMLESQLAQSGNYNATALFVSEHQALSLETATGHGLYTTTQNYSSFDDFIMFAGQYQYDQTLSVETRNEKVYEISMPGMSGGVTSSFYDYENINTGHFTLTVYDGDIELFTCDEMGYNPMSVDEYVGTTVLVSNFEVDVMGDSISVKIYIQKELING